MKKVLSITLLALFCLEANAQLQKGNIMIGGSLSFSNNSSEQDFATGFSSSEATSFRLSPKAGYLLSDRAVIGLGLGLITSMNEYTSNSSSQETRSKGLDISPFYRQYFSLSDKVAFFAHGTATLGFSKSKSKSQNGTDVDETEGNGTSYAIGIAPGVNYFLNEKWALEASLGGLGYSAGNSDTSGTFGSDIKSRGFNFNFGIDSFSFGLKYFISHK
jgi:hypothetical protein